MILTFRPIKTWPDGWKDPNRQREGSPFSAGYSATLNLLDLELRQLGATEITLQVDASDRDCRLDGQLRADAEVGHPGVILTMDTTWHGTLVYACDRFVAVSWRRGSATSWQCNLRAITLGLEALRKVERYGIAERGQQYAGYREIGSGTPMGPGAMTVEEAARLLCDATADKVGEDPTDIDRVRSVATSLWRVAALTHHPDKGGDPETFKRLTEAKELLTA